MGSSSAAVLGDRIPVAIVGASGYTGAELTRFLWNHPAAEIRHFVGHGKAGQSVSTVLPSLAGLTEAVLERFDPDAIARSCRAAFLALPHGVAARYAAELVERGVVVFDLSADFRLRDSSVHRAYYGDHHAPELIERAVYGLPELHRSTLASAELIAVPGCFPTASILPLAPLFARGWIRSRVVVIDAKTGVSGAGRTASERTHFSETAESIRAYKIAGTHRHTPEIEQELSGQARRSVSVTFTPHLVPMTRGILSTCYVELDEQVSEADCTLAARDFYIGSPSVVVLEAQACPDTLWVRGSNRAMIAYARDPRTGLVIAQGALDNLVKGASGQAIQCFNVRFGLPEGLGLSMPAVWP